MDIGLETLRRFEKLGRFHERLLWPICHWADRVVWEIGSGTGTVTDLLVRQGNRVIASDIRSDYVSLLTQRFGDNGLVRAVACDASDPAQVAVVACHQPDSAVCISVLEHVKDDRQLLRNANEVLRPQHGLLYLYVPAHQWLYSSLDVGLEHHRRYSRQGLTELAESAGFDVEGVWWLNLFGIPGWFLNGTVLRRDLQPREQLQAYDWLVPLSSAVETALGHPAGLNLAMVCRAR